MTKFLPSFLHSLVLTSTLGLPAVQAYFGRAKAACLCSYCCNRHLCYDGGKLGRVKIVTLRVGARAKEGKRGGEGPHLFSSFNVRFREQNIRAPEENACTAG